MRLPSTAHSSRPWRIHALTPDFRLEDVWALPTPGGPDDFPRLVEQFTSGRPAQSDSRAARALWAIRWKLGELLGWDAQDGAPGPSSATGCPPTCATARAGRTSTRRPFSSVYLLEDEWAAEIVNRTVHGVLHVGWVADGAGGHRGQMAVLVKPERAAGSAYMAAIKPFRHLIVYPPLLRQIARRWQAGDWDRRYAEQAGGMWSGRVNGVLRAELEGAPAGRALDVGCGEGADAIWLARAGWEVTGLDVSEVAIERAAAAARAAGTSVRWVCADVAGLPRGEVHDLVSVHYPALRRGPGEPAIRALLDAVAPGGTLLVVGHAPLDEAFARAHGFELADHVQPADVRAALGAGWEIEVDEDRPRVDPTPAGTPFTHDAVLRARRRR